ncbi:YwpF-like family protein [Paenalkalicoccus suaedae]|uniref:YwpF-like family protein n=1 Tax=Paenalkalicoccus suaedae TaxID=2592382 RepID=A0A859FD88_9BACI|nr:YwpF-like family protein [Paenalkalicoccus suaedae]QKS71323.1 YwpF-like family protein [Paenalkalicoccus suaedae]
MKTFTLCSFDMLLENKDQHTENHSVPLLDGLIINKEEAQKNWLIELVVHEEWKTFFEEYKLSQKKVLSQATITKKTNDPATLSCTVTSVFPLKEEQIVVHLEGSIVTQKDDVTDLLLETLIEEGFTGKELYEEFRKRKKDRGRAIQSVLTHSHSEEEKRDNQ